MRNNKVTKILFEICSILFIITSMVFPAPEVPGWEKKDKVFVLHRGDNIIEFRAPGTLRYGRQDGPSVTTAFFMWHDRWIYEQLNGGKVTTPAEIGKDGNLRQSGLWGTRDKSPPLSYVLVLEPAADGVIVRMEVEKTAELKLTAGLWCVQHFDRKTFNAGQRFYARPQAHGLLGNAVSGTCESFLIELIKGQAVSFTGDGFREIRGKPWGCEMNLVPNDFPAGQKIKTSLTIRFEPMPDKFPGDIKPCREKLAINAIQPNATTISKFGKLELAVDLKATWDNPYDPDDVALDAIVTTASGRAYTQPGFFIVDQKRVIRGGVEIMMPQGNGSWRVRLAATEEGPMHVKLTAKDRSGTVSRDAGTFTITSGKDHGFLRQSPVDPHYLRFDNGESFFPIGHNLPGYHTSGQLGDEAIRKMAANGENYNRWWMSESSLGIEWEGKLGWYRQAQAARLDLLLELAEKLGFYYMLCMDTHQDFRETGWKTNPFNKTNGGPCAEVKDWFTSETARTIYRKRLRYTVARWAWSPHVLCWEFGNEFEGWEDTDDATKIQWHAVMADYLAKIDSYRHLETTSWWSKTGPELCWQIPTMDIVQTHCYTGNDGNVGSQIRGYCLKQWEGFAKPHIFGEFGIRSGAGTETLDPKGWGLHNAFWAAMCSGSCGIAMPWWHENYIEPLNLYFHFQAIANFTKGLPFGTAKWEQVRISKPEFVTPPAKLIVRDLVLSTTSTWGKVPVNEFKIMPDGMVNDSKDIHALLHGKGHPDLKNPPVFTVDFPSPGRFIIKVGRVSRSGLLKVWVDDQIKLERPFPCGEKIGKESVYQPKWKLWESVYDEEVAIEVPAGLHRIKVDNDGGDWMTIRSYTFTGCRRIESPLLVVAALRSPDVTIAWIQNDESCWSNHEAGKIKPVPLSRVALEGFSDGTYQIEWWDTWNGKPIRTEKVKARKNRLTLLPGELTTDTAVRITRARWKLF
ncbi:MAG: DUF5060 domain-containing protein [Kiritimatiellae bacterium]|nr:DUF5060 domain-containing protein [Kiritimatiellia bacterium]MDD5519397.1 DUF5060 domain-containing protein [Kiritimatiellia bacterium]